MRGWKAFGVVILTAVPISGYAQTSAQNRIVREIGSNSSVELKGSTSPLAQSKYEIGPVSDAVKFSGVSIHFKLSPSQQADLDSLLRQQQDVSSAKLPQVVDSSAICEPLWDDGKRPRQSPDLADI